MSPSSAFTLRVECGAACSRTTGSRFKQLGMRWRFMCYDNNNNNNRNDENKPINGVFVGNRKCHLGKFSNMQLHVHLETIDTHFLDMFFRKLCDIVEPRNEGLVQMIFLFNFSSGVKISASKSLLGMSPFPRMLVGT